MSEFLASRGKLPAAEAGHAPCGPDHARVQLALGGDLHGQLELVLLYQSVPDPPSELRLGQLLDGGDHSGTRGDQLSQELHPTQVAVWREVVT